MLAVHLVVAYALAAFADASGIGGVVVAFILVHLVLRVSARLLGTGPYIARLELGVRFALWFVIEVFRASIDVARLVLAARVRTRPAVVAVRLRHQDDRFATVLGCLLTLTPGTLALDYDRAQGLLYVHALDAASAHEIEAGVRRIEDRMLAWMHAGRRREAA